MDNTIEQIFTRLFGEENLFSTELDGMKVPTEISLDAQMPGELKTHDSLILFFELPGSKKEDILLSIDKSTNLVKVKSISSILEKYNECNKKHCFNLPKRNFEYVIPVDSSSYDVDSVKATYENGVLEVVISKKPITSSEMKIDIN